MPISFNCNNPNILTLSTLKHMCFGVYIRKKINYIYFLYFTQTTPLSPGPVYVDFVVVLWIKQAKISKVYLSKKNEG